jgi:hypothetical protein
MAAALALGAGLADAAVVGYLLPRCCVLFSKSALLPWGADFALADLDET